MQGDATQYELNVTGLPQVSIKGSTANGIVTPALATAAVCARAVLVSKFSPRMRTDRAACELLPVL